MAPEPKTRTQHKEIVQHIYEVIGIDEETSKVLTDTLKLDTVMKIKNAGVTYLEKYCEQGKYTLGDLSAILSFQQWLKNSKISPKTLEEWKTLFDEESYEKYGSKEEIEEGKDTDALSVSTAVKGNDSKPETLNIKFSEYPDFSGRQNDWFAFKIMHESTARAHGYGELLDVSDIPAHMERRSQDSKYDEKVILMHAILSRHTAKGTALSHVIRFNDTRDGVLAWKALKDYYDQEGNKTLYDNKLWADLRSLKLKHTTYGGFDKYHSDFEIICKQLEEAGSPVPEEQKKMYFIENIEDRDFQNTKDLCAHEVYTNAVQKLRYKAALLGKQSGPTRRNQNKVTKKFSSGKFNKTNKTNDKGHEKDEKKGSNDGSKDTYYFPPETWKAMSPTARKKVIELRKAAKEKKEGTNYGKQYGINNKDIRKSNAATTVPDAEPPSEATEEENEDYGKAWTPVRRIHFL
jgi:hypothetical protein